LCCTNVDQDIRESKKDIKEVLFADFGCGDMAFARHLDAEVRKSDVQITKVTYSVHGSPFHLCQLKKLQLNL